MDYEKKYKELEGKIKKAYLYAQTDSTKAVLEDILPELAESEDEKIRKSIIENLKGNMYRADGDYDLLNKQIAWLEKQGGKPQGKTALEAWKDMSLEIQDAKDVSGNTKAEHLIPQKSMYYTCIKDYYSSDNTHLCVKGNVYKSSFNGYIDDESHFGLSWTNSCAEKYFEPTKDEDWIVCEHDNVIGKPMQYKEFKKKVNQKFIENLKAEGITPKLRIWTVKDAKDGDILSTLAGAFIYNGNNGGGSCPGCYCGINTLGNFEIGTEHHWTTKTVFPELQESEDEKIRKSIIENLKGNMYRADGDYDLLNKQIAWLEKQGEKPQGKTALEAVEEEKVDNANKVKPKFHEDEWIVWQDKCCKEVYPATKEQCDKLLKAMADAGYEWDANKKELKKIEKPTAWSQEDERMMLSIEQIMNCASLLNIVPQKIDKVRTWLKSIKERIGE